MGDPADTLKAMSDETRFRIVTILLNHDICAGAIARRLGISDAAVSQHMRVLREAGLVTSERRGYFTHFSVDRDAIRELADFLQTMSGWERGPCDPDLVAPPSGAGGVLRRSAGAVAPAPAAADAPDAPW